MTDGEARMLGTMKITNMKSHDRKTIELANIMLDDMPRGKWLVCQVREPKSKKPVDRAAANLGIIVGSEFVHLEIDRIDGMNKKELQDECRKRKLTVSGNKSDLASKLKKAIQEKVNCVIREQPGAKPTDGVEVEYTTTEEVDYDVAEDCCYVVFKDKKT